MASDPHIPGGKKQHPLKDTFKELENAFHEWDILESTPEEPIENPNTIVKERAKSILNKLKNQIEELSE